MPREAPRYSPTTTEMIAKPMLMWRLEKIQVSALGMRTWRINW